MASESDAGEWEYITTTMADGEECLTVMDKAPPGWASPELREAWALRREANVTGLCQCGAVFDTVTPYLNRHERRTASAKARKAGQRPGTAATAPRTSVVMLHDAYCPAGDRSIRRLMAASLN